MSRLESPGVVGVLGGLGVLGFWMLQYGFRFRDLGSSDLGFRILGVWFGFRVWGSGWYGLGLGLRLWVSDLKSRIYGLHTSALLITSSSY